MINVTNKAVEKFKELLKNVDNAENKMLRVSFEGFGWGGPNFQLALDELKGENDIIVESEGIKVIYDSEFKDYLKDVVINYSDSWFNRGFNIRGGNLSSC